MFRDAMSRLAGGVVMVTCQVDERPWGMTATACCSISAAPPLILVSLGTSTVSARAIGHSQRFGVSVLGSRALRAAHFASRQGRPKFIDEYCLPAEARGGSATPTISDAQAHIDCEVSEVHPVADHLLFIGAVRTVVLHPADRPLVYFSKGYHGLYALDGCEVAIDPATGAPRRGAGDRRDPA